MKLPIKDYLSLIKAGYTPDEINAFEEDREPTVEAQPEPAEEVAETVKPEPAEAPKAEPSNSFDISPLLAEIKLLRSDLQKSNIMNDQAIIKPAETAEQILASVITPSNRKGKE